MLQKMCEQLLLSGLSVFVERKGEVGTEECWRDSGDLEGKKASKLDQTAL